MNEHFTEAQRLASATKTRDWKDDHPYVDRRLSAATFHATLALAYEQRTANLIALLNADAAHPEAPIRFIKDIGVPSLSRTIAERLGYPQPEPEPSKMLQDLLDEIEEEDKKAEAWAIDFTTPSGKNATEVEISEMHATNRAGYLAETGNAIISVRRVS